MTEFSRKYVHSNWQKIINIFIFQDQVSILREHFSFLLIFQIQSLINERPSWFTIEFAKWLQQNWLAIKTKPTENNYMLLTHFTYTCIKFRNVHFICDYDTFWMRFK